MSRFKAGFKTEAEQDFPDLLAKAYGNWNFFQSYSNNPNEQTSIYEQRGAVSNNSAGEELPSTKAVRKEYRLTIFQLLIVLLIFIAVSGCGGSGATTVTSVSITPSSAAVAPGTQADFTATVNLANSSTTTSTSTAVTWEVNGVAGGNSTIGTILSSTTDNEVGIYTAPTVVPTTNNGQVNITAVAQQTNTTTTTSGNSTNTVTSNTATVTVAVTLGFSMSPTIASAAAGQTVQFSSILNGVTDVHTVWTVASSTGGNPGSIVASTGLYTAPLVPPSGNSITITGTDGTNSASETITITYSDHSLTGPYAFSYTGDNQLGFSAVAGSFVADGNGNIESGVEDTSSFQTGVTTEVAFTGNYVVNTDGTGSVNLTNGSTWRFVLAGNQHAVIVRSDVANTGSGAMDQQTVLTNSPSLITGAYVFSGSGAHSTTFGVLALAGRFNADGAGNIPAGSNILDSNDAGTVTTSDTTLSGSYLFDPNFPGSGRGTLTITSTATGSRQFAFYAVTSSQINLIEIDRSVYFVGQAFSAPVGTSFSAANLVAASYVFKVGGNSTTGAYAAAGLFTSDGAGNMTGGAFDANNAGTIQNNVTLTSCGYTVNSTTGRVDLKLCGAGTSEFAVYPTSQSSAVMVEIGSTAISSGIAYQQQSPSTAAPSGNFAIALAGQGIFHNSPSSYQQDVEGQLVLSSGSFTSGNLDINNFNGVFARDPVNTGTTTSGTTTTALSSFAAPGSNGRGTAVITGTNPAVSYKLVYYGVNANTTLLLDQDSGFVLNGVLLTQF